MKTCAECFALLMKYGWQLGEDWQHFSVTLHRWRWRFIKPDDKNKFLTVANLSFVVLCLLLQYDVVLHRLKKLASHPNAELATPFLLRFLEVIPIQGMRAVEKTVSTD